MTEPSTGWAMAFRRMLGRRAGKESACFAVWIALGFMVILAAGRAVTGSIGDALDNGRQGLLSTSQAAGEMREDPSLDGGLVDQQPALGSRPGT